MTPGLARAAATLATVVLVGAGVAGCSGTEASRPSAAAEPAPVAVTTAAAVERALPRVLEVTGALTADTQTEVATEVPGRVTAVLVERGAAVSAGAVLARLDDRDLENQLREAEALERQTLARLGLTPGQAFDPERTPDVRRARALVERAEIEYRRYERLVADGIVSRSEFDARHTDHATARAQHETLVNQMRELHQALGAQRARVALATKAVADTTVRAPFDGVVAERHASVGQLLAKGARVATVVRVDPLRVELTVPEAAAAAVHRGQRVAFTVQTHPGRAFQGTVAYVGPALRADTRALVAEAVVPNPGRALQPGLFATARVELPAAAPSVLVPVAAVRTEAGVSSVFVVRDGRAEQRLVQAGDTVGGWVAIVRGLRAGESVVTAPPDALADGHRVVVRGSGA